MLIALMHSVLFVIGTLERQKNVEKCVGTKTKKKRRKITCIYSTFHVECALRASCIGNESHYHFRSVPKIKYLSWIEDGNADNTKFYPTKEGKGTVFRTWNSFDQPSAGYTKYQCPKFFEHFFRSICSSFIRFNSFPLNVRIFISCRIHIYYIEQFLLVSEIFNDIETMTG